MADFQKILNDIQTIKEFELLKAQGLDPVSLLDEKRKSIEKYNYDTALRIAKNQVTGAFKRLQNTEEMSGVILSNSGIDRFNSKAPLNYPLLLNDGTILTASAWTSSIFKKAGKYTFRGTKNDVYKNVIVETATLDETFDTSKIPVYISKIAKTADSDFSVNEKHETVAITGVINWISAMPIWEENEKVGWEEAFDEKNNPVFNIVLETGVNDKEVKNHITFALQKNKNGRVDINHKELQSILQDASEYKFKDVDDAIDEITTLLKGIQITAIGELVSLKDAINNNNEPVCYITLRTLQILDLNISETKAEKTVLRGVETPAGETIKVPAQLAPTDALKLKLDDIVKIARDTRTLLGRLPTIEELNKQLTEEQIMFSQVALTKLEKEEAKA